MKLQQSPRSLSQPGALAVTLIYTVSALIAWPFSGTIHGDDFSYMKTALDFSRTGHLLYNGWASMMLGWQAVWGAAAIRLFGFSFNVLRLSMLLLSMASVFLLYDILVRFRVKNAAFGTLTLALSPLFMPLSVGFMSDIPGLLSVLLCIAMCQRAISASTAKTTILWLIAASATNLLSGTVRQICWLGALVMVPATGLLLRKRRGVPLTSVLLETVSLGFVLACLHWYLRQPYAVPEHILMGRIDLQRLEHLGTQYVKVCLYLVLLTLPVGVAWFSTLRSFTREESITSATLLLLVFTAVAISLRHGYLPFYVMPWLIPMLATQGMTTPVPPLTEIVTLNLATRVVISILVVVTAVICSCRTSLWQRQRLSRFYSGNQPLVWILFPFAIAVVCLMSPRGMFTFVQDRYLLLLIPILLITALRVFEDTESPTLPVLSYVTLAVFAYYGIAGLHDREAMSRAEVKAMAALQNTGVPRKRIAEAFGPDEWYEVGLTGHVNNGTAAYPANQHATQVPLWDVPPACMPFNFYLIPHIRPRYILKAYRSDAPLGVCYQPSRFAPVPYTAWAFPFHRAIYTSGTGKP